MTATNFEAAIQIKIRAPVKESGSMLVESRLLVGMLSLLPGELITFSADKPDVLRLKSNMSVYEVKCLPAKNYPKPVIPFPEDTVKISGICSLARRTVFAVAKEEQKPALQCVSVKLKNNTVTAAACDGIRIILVKDEAESADEQEFLLPGHSLQILSSISSDTDVYDVADLGNEVVFVKENMVFSMKKMPGTFIDTNALIKSVKPVYTAVANAEDIKNALDLITVASGSQPVNLILSNGQINLACDGERGAVHYSVTANVSVKTPGTGFYYSTAKLNKLFQIIDGKVKLELDSRGMLLVKTKNEVYLQAPMAKPVVKEKPAMKAAA